MPTMQDHLRALQRAKEAGDETAVQEIRARMVADQQTADRAEYNPADGMSRPEQAWAGFNRGVRQVGRNVGNMVGLVSDDALAEQAGLDAPLMETGYGQAGNMAGQAAATIAPAMLAGGGAALAGLRMGGTAGRVLSNPLARGAIEGATQGAMIAEPGEDRMGSAGIGAAAGAVIPGLLKAGQFVARGVNPVPEAQMLLDKGVDLTPGQMRPEGVLNTIEQSYDRVPVLGNAIRNARQNAANDIQRLAFQESAAPGATIAKSPDINQMFAQALDSYEPLYDQAKGFPIQNLAILKTNGPDEPLWTAIDGALSNRRIMATDSERTVVREMVRDELSALKGKAVTSDALLNVRSNIRKAKRAAETNGVRDLIGAAEKRFTDLLESQLPPDASSALKTADRQYAKLAVARKATVKPKDSPNGWTPHQFSSAVRESTDDTTYAKGGGLLRDIADAQASVLRTEVPATGARNAAYAAPVALMAATDPLISGALMGGGLLGAVGTKTGRQFMGGMLPWQQALQRSQFTGLLSNQADRKMLEELAARGLVSYAGSY